MDYFFVKHDEKKWESRRRKRDNVMLMELPLLVEDVLIEIRDILAVFAEF